MRVLIDTNVVLDLLLNRQPFSQDALALPSGDFEDATQIAAAVAIGAEAIVTRNLPDFVHSPVASMSPAEFLRQL